MRAVLRKLMDRAVDHVAIRTGWARRHFASQRGRICVLAYHGLIPDELADRPWVPSHFVTVRQFERQMATLAGLWQWLIRSFAFDFVFIAPSSAKRA